MTLSRLTIGRSTLSGASEVSCRMPSMRIRIMTLRDAGSMWRSEARSATAFSSSAFTSLTTGRVVDERAAADLGLDVVVVGRVVEASSR